MADGAMWAMLGLLSQWNQSVVRGERVLWLGARSIRYGLQVPETWENSVLVGQDQGPLAEWLVEEAWLRFVLERP